MEGHLFFAEQNAQSALLFPAAPAEIAKQFPSIKKKTAIAVT